MRQFRPPPLSTKGGFADKQECGPFVTGIERHLPPEKAGSGEIVATAGPVVNFRRA